MRNEVRLRLRDWCRRALLAAKGQSHCEIAPGMAFRHRYLSDGYSRILPCNEAGFSPVNDFFRMPYSSIKKVL